MEHEFHPAIVALAAELGLTPHPVRGRSQCSFHITINGTPMTLWVGHYPGFAADPAYKWQASLSVKADAVRWGLTGEGVKEFLKSSLFLNPVPVARKGRDLKALRKG